jgi:excisionase family DNA binding protein
MQLAALEALRRGRAGGDLLTVKEAQAFLRVSRTTMWRLLRHGELRAHKIGSQVRIRRSDIESYLEANRYGRPGGQAVEGEGLDA